ncbi:hypothetical protein RI367_006339 [Sorochytrium milnesiophthora]
MAQKCTDMPMATLQELAAAWQQSDKQRRKFPDSDPTAAINKAYSEAVRNLAFNGCLLYEKTRVEDWEFLCSNGSIQPVAVDHAPCVMDSDYGLGKAQWNCNDEAAGVATDIGKQGISYEVGNWTTHLHGCTSNTKNGTLDMRCFKRPGALPRFGSCQIKDGEVASANTQHVTADAAMGDGAAAASAAGGGGGGGGGLGAYLPVFAGVGAAVAVAVIGAAVFAYSRYRARNRKAADLEAQRYREREEQYAAGERVPEVSFGIATLRSSPSQSTASSPSIPPTSPRVPRAAARTTTANRTARQSVTATRSTAPATASAAKKQPPRKKKAVLA